jgi:hypothetical protein
MNYQYTLMPPTARFRRSVGNRHPRRHNLEKPKDLLRTYKLVRFKPVGRMYSKPAVFVGSRSRRLGDLTGEHGRRIWLPRWWAADHPEGGAHALAEALRSC